jgi:hypothetical protein
MLAPEIYEMAWRPYKREAAKYRSKSPRGKARPASRIISEMCDSLIHSKIQYTNPSPFSFAHCEQAGRSSFIIINIYVGHQ